MSLKVYNGFVYKGPTDLLSVNRWLDGWYDVFRTKAETAQQRLIVELGINEFDRAHVQHKLDTIDRACVLDFVGASYEEVRERQKKIVSTRRRDPEVDFEFTVNLFPTQDKVLGSIGSEQRGWVLEFMKDPHVVEYGWTSQTDGGDLGEEEWQRRADDWWGLFGQNKGYGDIGLSRTFVHTSNFVPPPKPEAIPDLLPRYEIRQHLAARYTVPVKHTDPDEAMRYVMSDKFRKDTAKREKEIEGQLLSKEEIAKILRNA